MKKGIIAVCMAVLMVLSLTGGAFAGNEGDLQRNVYYGTNAGFSLDGTGYYNAFFGYGAGQSTTGGDYNTFVGYFAGYDNTTGHDNTFVGDFAGYYNTTGYYNTFLGDFAGTSNTTGIDNTFVGYVAGYYNTTGDRNTFLGDFAGTSNTTGHDNVFLGSLAGYYETGSNRLYIDNSTTSTPLIYGEFDNRILTINGNLEVIGPYYGLVRLSDNTTNSTTKASRMVLNHYTNTEEPVYLFGAASTSTDNFVAFGGGSAIGNAATQIDLFTAENNTTPTGTPRLTIKGNGYVGIGTLSPSYPLQVAGVAYSNGWYTLSSREYKENIRDLKAEDAVEALKVLNPVTFNFKADSVEDPTLREETHAGFIAEDVPDLVATKDRKGLSSMDIVAVLTKVNQEHQRMLQEQQKVIDELSEKVRELERKNGLRGGIAMAGIE